MAFSLFRGKEKSADKPHIGLWLLAQLLILYFELVRLTSLNRDIGFEKMRALDEGGKPFIVVFWHGNAISVSLAMFRCLKTPAYVLLSRSPYGAFLVPFVKHLGYRTIRGSGTGAAANKPKKEEKGGREAFRKMLGVLNKNEVVISTADIAPGPSYESGVGMVLLASRAGVPIISVSAAYRRFKLFPKSWDRFQLAFPFNRRVTVWSEPRLIKPDLTAEELEQERLALTAQMNMNLIKAHKELGLPSPHKTDES